MFNELGIEVFLPWRDSEAAYYRSTLAPLQARRKIFEADRDGVDVCHGLALLAEGPDGGISSGTAWEWGYAYERNKIIIGLRTDYRGRISPILERTLEGHRLVRDFEEFRDLARRVKKRLVETRLKTTKYVPPREPRKLRRAYLATPHYALAEQEFARKVLEELENAGFSAGLYSQEANLAKRWNSMTNDEAEAVFAQKIRALDGADFVVAVLEGADCESETSWDCGYAYSQYKPIFAFRSDYRSLGDMAGPINLMLEQSAIDSRICGALEELIALVVAKAKS